MNPMTVSPWWTVTSLVAAGSLGVPRVMVSPRLGQSAADRPRSAASSSLPRVVLVMAQSVPERTDNPRPREHPRVDPLAGLRCSATTMARSHRPQPEPVTPRH